MSMPWDGLARYSPVDVGEVKLEEWLDLGGLA